MPLLSVNGTTLFCDVTGPADAPPVVFSNSLGTTLEMWDAQVRALAGRYRLVRYDTRGHGRSPVSDGPVDIDLLADDVAGLMDALAIPRAVVVGLSLGGMTAQALAMRHADRVAGLVLMATAPHLPPADAWETRAQTVLAQGMGAIVEAVMARWFTPAMAQTDPARLAFLRARFLAIDPAGYAACCRAIGGLDLRSGLGAIRAPTLVVAGAADPVTSPAVGEALAKAIPGAGCEVVDDAAHIPAAEQPEAVNAILGTFLDRHWPAGTAIDALARGLSNRKAVLGVEHVQRSLEQGGPFVRPWQEFISRTAWGEIWGDTTLPFKTRSIIVLSMMVALHREEEFKLHLRPALKNGLTLEELRALLLQTAIYGGVPAANAAFRWVKEVLGAEADTIGAPPA